MNIKIYIKYVLLLVVLLVGVPLLFNHLFPIAGWVLALSWVAYTANELNKDIKQFNNNHEDEKTN